MESQLSRNGAETDADMEEGKYVAEESAKELIAGLLGLDYANIRCSDRTQKSFDDFIKHAPKKDVTLEQLREQFIERFTANIEKLLDETIDQLEKLIDDINEKQ